MIALVLAVALAVASFTVGLQAADSQQWRLDPARSEVTFTVTKLGFSDVTGRFHDFNAEFAYDPRDPGRSRVSWEVAVASVKTGEPRRDESLQGAPYFDSSRFPTLRFVSDRVRLVAENQLEVHGQITIRGVTRPLTITVIKRARQATAGHAPIEVFETAFTLDRYDFGVEGGNTLGRLISRQVRIRLVAAIQPANIVARAAR
jgi:polyisoprenoid-binding protein YceI